MTATGIAPVLQSRFSPLRFDSDHQLSEADVAILLEAARWAPSAGNSQPWAFHFRRRGDAGHAALVDHLAASSRRWAPQASALVVNLAQREVDDSGIEYSEFADYDLGQAVAHMTVQAHSMGLACRQFRAFNLDALHDTMRVAPGWQILTMTAIGVAADDDQPIPRHRRSITDLITAGVAPPDHDTTDQPRRA
ncbi:nitroreductase family protein [Micromonospora arborensis]|uniref:nitroreductase family protein n=1 Tax=Micromonospora arborensis TaxID=2116518 RepID=UPI001FC9B51C|nr:nitroreductase family protein [Micromonospora arborensis]